MSRWLILVIAVSVGISTFLIGRFVVPPAGSEHLPPLTYTLPIKVISSTEAGVIFETQRCNNKEQALAITATVFWQSGDLQTLIPFRPINSGTTSIPVGCEIRRSMTPAPTDYLTPGRWRLMGNICLLDGECTGWHSEWADVQ